MRYQHYSLPVSTYRLHRMELPDIPSLPKVRNSTSSTSVPAMPGVCSFSDYGPRSSRNRLPTGSSLPRMMRKANLKASACLSGDLIWEPEARNRERLRRFSRAQEPNAFSMLTASTTGANRLDSASFSSSPSREVCLISSPSATQHPCSIPRTDSQPTQGAAAPSI